MILKDSLLLNEYVNRNNLPAITNKLMDASNIKIANNKYGNRVQTVIDKIVEKADNVTKAINQEVINTDYSFKVGTGTNVDVSSDVQDGFGKVGLKGVTYQNLINFYNKEYTPNVNINSNIKPAMKTDTWYTVYINVIKNTLDGPVRFSIYNLQGGVGGVASSDSSILSDTNILSNGSTGVWCGKFKFTALGNSSGNGFTPTFTLFSENATKGSYIANAILLEGDYTNDPNLPSYFEGIVGVGDIGKNLFNGQIERGYYNAQGIKCYGERAVRSVNFISVSPNTTYTISSNTSTFYYILYCDYQYNVISQISVNKTFTTPNNCMFIKFNTTNDNAYVDLSTKFQIEKGNTITSFEQYCFKINTISNGYNLLNLLSLNCSVKNYVTKHEITSNSISFSVGAENSDPWASVMFDGFKFKENTTYRIKAKCKTTDNTNSPFISLRQKNDYNKSFMDMGFTNGILNITFLANNVGDRIEFFAGVNKGDKGGCQVEFWDVCLTEELSNGDLPFQPYLKNTSSVTIDSPLMRLPNGVYDEITVDSKLIRRVGKYRFTGNEYWFSSEGNTTNRHRIYASILPNKKASKLNAIGYCNNIKLMPNNKWYLDMEMIEDDSTFISIRSTIKNVDDFKRWLQRNEVIIYYELAEPVITDIMPPSVRIYKDGHLTFNTLVAPESTHYVQLNKSAQINNTLEEIQSLNKKVNALDIIYNSLISSTSSTLSNLNK